MGSNSYFPIAIGAIAALLQLVLAPALTIFEVMPNFLVATAIAYIAVSSDEPHYLFAFVMGLVSDLLGATPLGAASIALLVCAFAIPMAVEAVGNDTAFGMAALMFASALVYGLVFGILVCMAGLIGPLEVITYIALPYTVYDGLVALAVMFILSRLGTGRKPRSGETMSNIRFN